MAGPGKYKLFFITINGYLSERLNSVRSRQGWHSWRPGIDDLPLGEGPSNPRLAVIDHDANGGVRQGAKLQQQNDRDGVIKYEVEVDRKERANLVRQVSVFSTMLRTLSLFEADDVLARPLRWATEHKQLKVVINQPDPRGASYDRTMGKIIFGSFPSLRHPGETVYTAGCPDIVAHETAHAVLDSLAPDLYHGLDPQCSAIHEAVADLTSMFVALEMDSLREHILEKSDGNMRDENAFGWIAEEYGYEQDESSTSRGLRNLYSEASFQEDSDEFVSRRGGFYDQSVVFSSAYYASMIDEYERIRSEQPNESSGLALYRAASKFRRALARALDYLPPSNIVTLLDLCRAIVHADAYAYPDSGDSDMREKLIERFLSRGIGCDDDFNIVATEPISLFDGCDIEAMVSNPELIETVLNKNRGTLKIPENATLSITASIVNKKRWLSRRESRWVSEAIIKFSWQTYEQIELSNGRRRRLDIKLGTTLVVHPESGALKLLLTTNRKLDGSHDEYATERRGAQQDYVSDLVDSGRLTDVSGLSELERQGLNEPYWHSDGETIQIRNVNVGSALHGAGFRRR